MTHEEVRDLAFEFLLSGGVVSRGEWDEFDAEKRSAFRDAGRMRMQLMATLVSAAVRAPDSVADDPEAVLIRKAVTKAVAKALP